MPGEEWQQKKEKILLHNRQERGRNSSLLKKNKRISGEDRTNLIHCHKGVLPLKRERESGVGRKNGKKQRGEREAMTKRSVEGSRKRRRVGEP